MNDLTEPPELFDAETRRAFRRRLIAWYERVARDLPWRRTRDPYAVWVSETMLQQTTVAAVVPYYERFLTRFPTVRELAAAAEDEVLSQWEGLGYYSRARNLHRAARQVVEQHGGEFPRDLDAVRALPGVGRYTAGAIVSFAFDRPAPIVEANTLRLYSRLLAYTGDPKSAAGQRLLWRFAEDILPRTRPGRFNHALMELGATVCRPAEPDCAACPVHASCRAFRMNVQTELPRPAARPQVTERTEVTLAVQKDGAYLLRRRQTGEWWAGLWDFPRWTLTDDEAAAVPIDADRRKTRKTTAPRLPGLDGLPADVRRRLIAQTAAQTGVTARFGPLVTVLRHGVTRYRIRLLCFRADHHAGELSPDAETRWVRPAEFSSYPLSVTGRRFAGLLAKAR
jgi:A/G-specific adenine glycosylase